MKRKPAAEPKPMLYAFDGVDLDADLFVQIDKLHVAHLAVRGISEKANGSEIDPEEARAVADFLDRVRREFSEIKESISVANKRGAR
jgi:hypothetical protein